MDLEHFSNDSISLGTTNQFHDKFRCTIAATRNDGSGLMATMVLSIECSFYFSVYCRGRKCKNDVVASGRNV